MKAYVTSSCVPETCEHDWNTIIKIPQVINKSTLKLLYKITLLWFALVIASGCNDNQGMKDTKDINVLAQQIDRQLMCPVCPSETIDQSQTLIAKQMKAIIRDKLNQGQNTKEILNYFVDRYGIEILTEPPKSGWHLLIWIVPPVGLLLGSAIVGLIILSMRKNSLENINQPQLGDINKYLLEVEKVLENTDTEAHTNNPQKNETGDN